MKRRTVICGAILIVVVFLLGAVAPIVPVAIDVSDQPREEQEISNYALLRLTDFALIRTAYMDPSMVDIVLVGYPMYRDGEDGNVVRELERRFFQNPGKILTKGIVFLFLEKWKGNQDSAPYLLFKTVLSCLYYQLPGTPDVYLGPEFHDLPRLLFSQEAYFLYRDPPQKPTTSLFGSKAVNV